MFTDYESMFWDPAVDTFESNPSKAVDMQVIRVAKGERLKIVAGFQNNDVEGWEGLLIQTAPTGVDDWYDVALFTDYSIVFGDPPPKWKVFLDPKMRLERYVRLGFSKVVDPGTPQPTDIGIGFTSGTGLYGYIVPDQQTAR